MKIKTQNYNVEAHALVKLETVFRVRAENADHALRIVEDILHKSDNLLDCFEQQEILDYSIEAT